MHNFQKQARKSDYKNTLDTKKSSLVMQEKSLNVRLLKEAAP